MLLDIHLHTSRFSPCAMDSPEDMLSAACESGLDGVVLTEHRRLWPAAELESLRRQFPCLTILNGVEITSLEQEDLVVYGVDDVNGLEGSPAASVIAAVRACGGATVLAHPFRYHEYIAPRLYGTPPDACESWSLNIFGFQRQAISEFRTRTGCPRLAVSDAHSAAAVGIYASRFPCFVGNERELAAAIRHGDWEPAHNPARLAQWEEPLAAKMEKVREALAAGLAPERIRIELGCGQLLIEHVQAGRQPSFAPDPPPFEFWPSARGWARHTPQYQD